MKPAQILTDENKYAQLERCSKLLQRAAVPHWAQILFSDEKPISKEQSYNSQNDWICIGMNFIAILQN